MYTYEYDTTERGVVTIGWKSLCLPGRVNACYGDRECGRDASLDDQRNPEMLMLEMD